jgi:formate hydrogenlyase transcriptional activator
MDDREASKHDAGRQEAEDWQYRLAVEVMDLVALHTQVDQLLPDLARCLFQAVRFDAMVVVLSSRDGRAADLYTVEREPLPDTPSTPRLEVVTLPPLHGTRFATLSTTTAPVVLHSLEDQPAFPELLGSLRERGYRSACLLPLTTALRPVGVVGFLSSEVGAFDDEDMGFAGRLAAVVATAIDNVRQHEESLAHQRQLEAERRELAAERDHWRTLLEINNVLVSKLDLQALLAVITPCLRQMVVHDHTSLFLTRGTDRIELLAIDPGLPASLVQAVPSLRMEETEFPRAVGLRRPLDLDLSPHSAVSDGLGEIARVGQNQRMCLVPLITPRQVLGALTLGRLLPEPFTDDEMDRAWQLGAQVAIALENALAFQEIAALRDRLAQENLYLEGEIRGKQHFEEIIGDSKGLQRVLAQVRSVAPTDTAVLLLGETGTGKELIARAIHSMSERRSRTLVTVNCATSPAGLLESEWFGHEKGAFTGALAQKTGRFELAHQGTLFLDEIGDVPLDLQSKLLRALQQHEIERLGSTRVTHVDFRLVAATNRDLQEMVAKREYRADLYYRLNVFPIRIPPLRERREDIPPLVRYFVQLYAKRLKRPIDSVARESMDALCRWHWPGNVRELQNVTERAVILCQGTTLRIPLAEFEIPSALPTEDVLTLEDAERQHILRALHDCNWVIGGPEGAAKRLDLKRTTLVSTMRRLGIVRPGRWRAS